MQSKSQIQGLISTNLPTNASPKIRSVKHREVENALLDYSTNTIKVATVVSGSVITDSNIVNRLVGEISINGYTKSEGFTKNLNDNFLTFTDGTTVDNGDIVIIKLL